MKRDDIVFALSITCAVSSVIGTLLTASIALGINRHLSHHIEKKCKWFRADFGDGHSRHYNV